jgi:hypothetical protein
MARKARKPPIVGNEIFTFREGKMWIAAWRRFDLVAQGKTEREACERLLRQIAFQAIWDAVDGNLKEFGSCKPSPAALVTRWIRSHNQAHMN